MKITIPLEIKELMEQIQNQSYHVYLVGGYVRDQILGRENKDYDLCTDMPLEEIKKLYPKFNIMRENDHRNTGNIRIGNLEVEISSFRGKNLQEDLSERDFTMNAIAADQEGNIIDYFNGIDDIKNKKISLIKKNGEGIIRDPIRILRALRFQGTLGFTLEEETEKVLRERRYLLNQAAPERTYQEFAKILCTENATKIIRDYSDIFCVVVPELQNAIGFQQHNPYHDKDVFEHTLSVIDNVPNIVELKLAALFHDLGKPYTYSTGEDGTGHFLGHANVSEKIFHDFAKKYELDKKTESMVAKLVYFHERTLSKKPVKITKFLQSFGTQYLDSLFRLKEADIKGQNPALLNRLEELKQIEEIYKQKAKNNPCLTVKDLKINGRTLIKMGFYNQEIGIILKDVLDKVTCEQLVNEERPITSYVENHYK